MKSYLSSLFLGFILLLFKPLKISSFTNNYLVISGQNLRSAGGLSVLLQVLQQVSSCSKDFHCICFISSKKIIPTEVLYNSSFSFIELPLSSQSWLVRLYYEYFGFFLFSLFYKINVWLALHDITPNVVAKSRLLLFHNAILFWKPPLSELLSSPPVLIAWVFYKFFFRLGLLNNDYLIVQAFWIKSSINSLYKYPDSKIIVLQNESPFYSLLCPQSSQPSCHPTNSSIDLQDQKESSNNLTYRLIYPCFPRPFKNLYRLLQAVSNLYASGVDLSLVLTFDESSNKLAKALCTKFVGPPFIFTGFLPRNILFDYYQSADALIFPSSLETLGLPLIEFSHLFPKPILAADLPYAHEALKDHTEKLFFNPSDVQSIQNCIHSLISSSHSINKYSCSTHSELVRPNSVRYTWKSILDFFLTSPTNNTSSSRLFL